MLETVIVVPARWGSSRFPGKPLEIVAGRPILARTLAIAAAVPGIGELIVATDDERIAAAAKSFGARPVMTPASCATGSDRVAAAVAALARPPEAAINLQGDAILTPPWVLTALVETVREHDGIVTPAVILDAERYAEFVAAKAETPASGTTVVVDNAGHALYFSKQVLPFVRDPMKGLPLVRRHIGVYGYRRAALERFSALPPSPLERAEGLEQLRALQNGIPIRVVDVDYRGRTHASIDHPDDVARAEAIIAREGELVP